jgi:anti-sigma B factor antagonist
MGVEAMTTPRRRLEVEDIGDVTVVNFTSKKLIDEQTIQSTGEELFSLVDEPGQRKILLNFGNVEYLSSAALGMFITLNKKVRAAGRRLILCNINPQLSELFSINGLNTSFDDDNDDDGGGMTLLPA